MFSIFSCQNNITFVFLILQFYLIKPLKEEVNSDFPDPEILNIWVFFYDYLLNNHLHFFISKTQILILLLPVKEAFIYCFLYLALYHTL